MSVGTASNTAQITVFVRLLGEGTEGFRPTKAFLMGGHMAKLLAVDGQDPEDEAWEFRPDAIVRFERRTRDGAKENVAIALPSSS